MVDAKPLLKSVLDESDYVRLGVAVVQAYRACDELMESNHVLSNYAVGMEKRSLLISAFVEFEMSRLEGFFTEIKTNTAKNCLHTRAHKNGITITAHFLGRGETPRNLPRAALHRAALAGRNLSLFDDASLEGIAPPDQGYCWLLHHGVIQPRYAALAIPTAEQDGIMACTELPLPPPHLSEVEHVREDMVIQLLADRDNEDAQTG